MNLIRKRRTESSPLKNAAAKKIADCIVRLQIMLVKVLKQTERRCSMRQKKILFTMFCALAAASLLYILAGAFIVSDGDKATVPPPVTGPPPPVLPPLLPPAAKDSLTRHGRKY